MLINKVATGLALLVGFVAAHPGHDVAQEAAERREYLQSVKRTSLAHCAEELKAQGIHARNAARRQAIVEKARQKRGLETRSFSSVLATDHSKTGLGYSRNTDATTLFAGYKSCLLTPEVTQGPYYVAGEYVRENVVESQPGVSLLLDYQVINVATCKPVPNVYVEIWHCNSTGVYGGIVANGNGNSADASNAKNSWLRGIQPTNSDGVAQFESVFPGHYTGRTTHIHVMVHTKATLLANNTLGFNNYASHVGQTFFDQSLITAVEKVSPYSTNKQQLTTNSADMIMSQEAGTEGVDPVMEYTLLGSTVADGLYAWIAFGIDTTKSQAISPANYLYQQTSTSTKTTSTSTSTKTTSTSSSIKTTSISTSSIRTTTTTTASSACQTVAGGAAVWAQCGGIGYTGATSCASGKCTYYNDYYSQCIPC